LTLPFYGKQPIYSKTTPAGVVLRTLIFKYKTLGIMYFNKRRCAPKNLLC